MKEYQVVSVHDTNAERHHQVICVNPGRTREGTIELVMNWYAKQGWTVKAVTNSSQYATLVTFERDIK